MTNSSEAKGKKIFFVFFGPDRCDLKIFKMHPSNYLKISDIQGLSRLKFIFFLINFGWQHRLNEFFSISLAHAIRPSLAREIFQKYSSKKKLCYGNSQLEKRISFIS